MMLDATQRLALETGTLLQRAVLAEAERDLLRAELADLRKIVEGLEQEAKKKPISVSPRRARAK